PDGDAAVDVAPSLLGEALQQGLLGPRAGQLLEGVHRHLADTRGSGLKVLDSHRVPSLQALEDLDAVAFLELDDGLLPVRAAPDIRPPAAHLATDAHRVDADDRHAEDLLDRLLDLRLVGVQPDLEGVLALAHLGHALLRDERLDDDVARLH